jgi:hypothetical protein
MRFVNLTAGTLIILATGVAAAAAAAADVTAFNRAKDDSGLHRLGCAPQ